MRKSATRKNSAKANVQIAAPAPMRRAASAFFRASTTEALTELGYGVVEAADGADALVVFRERGDEIAAVVLGLLMPNMGGKECFLALREAKPGLPVLLVTGCAMNDDIPTILDGGVGAWLEKPYDTARLADSLTLLDIA